MRRRRKRLGQSVRTGLTTLSINFPILYPPAKLRDNKTENIRAYTELETGKLYTWPLEYGIVRKLKSIVGTSQALAGPDRSRYLNELSPANSNG